jgi:hypothetical protein
MKFLLDNCKIQRVISSPGLGLPCKGEPFLRLKAEKLAVFFNNCGLLF